MALETMLDEQRADFVLEEVMPGGGVGGAGGEGREGE
jgi:hypothetical protein